jgi:hypothetical protein
MKILGALLIVVGLLGVAYGGLSFTRKDKLVDVGPITVTKDKRNEFRCRHWPAAWRWLRGSC